MITIFVINMGEEDKLEYRDAERKSWECLKECYQIVIERYLIKHSISEAELSQLYFSIAKVFFAVNDADGIWYATRALRLAEAANVSNEQIKEIESETYSIEKNKLLFNYTHRH